MTNQIVSLKEKLILAAKLQLKITNVQCAIKCGKIKSTLPEEHQKKSTHYKIKFSQKEKKKEMYNKRTDFSEKLQNARNAGTLRAHSMQ